MPTLNETIELLRTPTESPLSASSSDDHWYSPIIRFLCYLSEIYLILLLACVLLAILTKVGLYVWRERERIWNDKFDLCSALIRCRKPPDNRCYVCGRHKSSSLDWRDQCCQSSKARTQSGRVEGDGSFFYIDVHSETRRADTI